MQTGAYTVSFRKGGITISVTIDVFDDEGMFVDTREIVDVADEAIWADLGISPISWGCEWNVTGPWNTPLGRES